MQREDEYWMLIYMNQGVNGVLVICKLSDSFYGKVS